MNLNENNHNLSYDRLYRDVGTDEIQTAPQIYIQSREDHLGTHQKDLLMPQKINI